MTVEPLLIKATEEIFSSCVAISVSAGLPFQRDVSFSDEFLVGMIELSGQFEGHLAILMDATTATHVTSDFLFIEEDEVEEESLRDTLGELVNILAGQLKASFDPQGTRIHLSLPRIASGASLVAQADAVTIPFYLDDGEFFVEARLKNLSAE